MAEDISQSEYSAQFFQFTPESFFKEFSEVVLSEMSAVVQHSIKEMSSPNCKIDNKQQLIKSTLEVHDEWSQQAEVVLKDLQPIIKEFFTIPTNVVLPVFSEYEKNYSEDDINKLEEEVKGLEERCARQVSEIQMYKKELAMLEHFATVQEKVDDSVNYLKKVVDSVNEVKELDRLIEICENNLKTIVSTQNGDCEDNDDGDGEANYDLAILEGKFKTV